MASSAADAFDTAEQTCESQYPGCGCAEQAPVAEDGKQGDFSTPVPVRCDSGQCTTYIP